MRTLAVALAAAALGTGCIVDTDDDYDYVPVRTGQVNLYWEFIRNAPAQPGGAVVYDGEPWIGTATGACPQSAVEAVRVDSAAGLIDVNCQEWNPADGVSVQGITIAGLPEGSQTVRVRGYRGDAVVYDSAVQLTVVRDAVVEVFAPVEAVSAPFELYGDLAFGDPAAYYLDCTEAGFPNLTFALYDSLGTLVDDGEVGCSDPLPAVVHVTSLDLDGYTARLQGIATTGPAAGQVVFDSCGVEFDHFGESTGAAGVVVDLFTQPVPICPP
jgi:hypothetical protein